MIRFSHNQTKRRWQFIVLLTSLLWFQLFLMFSAREALNVEALRPTGISVLRTLERTGSELVLPAKSDRSRVRIFVLFLLTTIIKPSFCNILNDPFPAESDLALGVWEALIGRELSSQPHSDMVLRI